MGAKISVALLLCASFGAQAADYKAPRGPGGKHPDLNGIWQALNTANTTLKCILRVVTCSFEKPSGLCRSENASAECGRRRTVGLGVVEGGKIPYRPEALAKKQENKERLIEIRK